MHLAGHRQTAIVSISGFHMCLAKAGLLSMNRRLTRRSLRDRIVLLHLVAGAKPSFVAAFIIQIRTKDDDVNVDHAFIEQNTEQFFSSFAARVFLWPLQACQRGTHGHVTHPPGLQVFSSMSSMQLNTLLQMNMLPCFLQCSHAQLIIRLSQRLHSYISHTTEFFMASKRPQRRPPLLGATIKKLKRNPSMLASAWSKRYGE